MQAKSIKYHSTTLCTPALFKNKYFFSLFLVTIILAVQPEAEAKSPKSTKARKSVLYYKKHLKSTAKYFVKKIVPKLNSDIQQILMVESKSTNSRYAQLMLIEKHFSKHPKKVPKNGEWRVLLGPIPAMIGKKGFAAIHKKYEGDLKTPPGLYPIVGGFGYQKLKLNIPYKQVLSNDYWVDDPDSSQYNQWVQGCPKAKSYETLRRRDQQYRIGLIIGYNMDPIIKGRGSAIFLHIWRKYGAGTAGCVAIAPHHQKRLVKLLHQDKKPHIMMATPKQYKKIWQGKWKINASTSK